MTKRFFNTVIIALLLVIGMLSFSACDILAEFGIEIGPSADVNPDNNGKPDEGDKPNDSDKPNEGDKPNDGNVDDTPAHVHNYVAEETKPTCVTGGYTTYTCECGDEYTDKNTEPLGHEFSEYVSDGNSTCVQDGTESAHCSRNNCEEIDTRISVGSALEHEYTETVKSEEYLKAEATCTSGTVYYKSCVCGLKSENETFVDADILPHPTDDTWCFNETHHWKKSVCECNVEVDYALHDVGKDGSCTVCEKLVLPTEGIVYTISSDGTHYNVTGYTGSASRIKIADTYESLPVTLVAYRAFENCNNVTSIELPDSITQIAAGAFYYCTGLKSIISPESVAKIGLGAFEGCKSLEEITLPFVGDQIKTDADLYHYPLGYIFGTNSYNGSTETKQSFRHDKPNYTSNTSYYIPDSLHKVTVTGGTLLGGAFYNCSQITEVVICSGVTAIGGRVFYKCSSLKNVTICDGVTGIGEYAFYQCYALTEMVVPDSVTKIGVSAFEECTKLEKITLPFIGGSLDATAEASVFGYIFGYKKQREGTSSTGGVEGATYQYADYSNAPTYVYAYYYYIPASLKEVVINGGKIGQSKVINCTDITTFILSDDVTVISKQAFYNCAALTDVVIGKGVTEIYAQAFDKCVNLTNIYYNGTVEEWNAITKGASWNSGVPATEVICSDGTVSLI